MTIKYPEFQTPETDKNVKSTVKQLLEFAGLESDNIMWIKRPKIILILDDLSGTSLF